MNEQKKISILGYFGHDNAGDERFKTIFHHFFHNHKLAFFEAWKDLDERTVEIQQGDLLIIGGGGLIINNSNSVISSLKNITIPIHIIGISANNANESNVELIRYLSATATSIAVRDEPTQRYFRQFRPNVQLIPDITFGKKLEATVNPINMPPVLGVSLRNWHFHHTDQYTPRYYRYERLNHHAQKLKLRYPFRRYWNEEKARRIITDLGFTTNQLQFAPEDPGEILLTSSNLVSELSRCDYVIAMRLHACIFATQLSIPFIALSYSSKVKNYMQGIGLSNYTLELNETRKIPSKIHSLVTHRKDIESDLTKITFELQKDVTSFFRNFTSLYLEA